MDILSFTDSGADAEPYLQINILFRVRGVFGVRNIPNDRNYLLFLKALELRRGIGSKNMHNVDTNFIGRENADKIQAS
jgi:hypothetical protein